MDELTAAQQWLYATLTGDATLAAVHGGRVYRGAIPGGAPSGIAIVFQCLSANEVYANGASASVVTIARYIVKVVGVSDSDAAIAATVARMRDVLHAGATGRVRHCYRDRPVTTPDYSDPSRPRAQMGGEYLLTIV